MGLGLKVYEGKYSAADPRPETYTAYLESLAVFAAWLLEHDYDIRLLLGDGDTIVIERVQIRPSARLGSYDEERIIEQPIASVQDVLAELAATDVVVATRFHNVLLAMLLNKPVIAISFHHKCSSLMRQMKLSEYCHDIDHMDTDRLIEQFHKLEQQPRSREAHDRSGRGRGARGTRRAVRPPLREPLRRPTGDVPRARICVRLETAFLRVNERHLEAPPRSRARPEARSSLRRAGCTRWSVGAPTGRCTWAPSFSAIARRSS